VEDNLKQFTDMQNALDVSNSNISDAGPSNLGRKMQNGIDGHSSSDRQSMRNERWPLVYNIALADAAIAPSHISGSQDLLARLDLLGSYDKAVRPYLSSKTLSKENSPDQHARRRGVGGVTDVDGATFTADVSGDRAMVEKAKSMKKHYSHMINDVPGQNKLAKDHHIRSLLLNPDGPGSTKLISFDSNALRDAFTLDIGVLPDFDTSIWRADAADEQKKKKKRKQEDAITHPNGAPSFGPIATATALPSASGNMKKRKTDV